MSMKTMLRGLLVTAMLIIVGTPVLRAGEAAAPAGGSYEVVQIWACGMKDGTTEEQVESIAKDWLKAIRQMPGGEAVKVRVFFPAVVNNTSQTDFYFVLNSPSFTEWGKLWDAYQDDSAAAKSDDLNQGKVVCPDNMLWEAHAIE
jgi:hypothetical protein